MEHAKWIFGKGFSLAQICISLVMPFNPRVTTRQNPFSIVVLLCRRFSPLILSHFVSKWFPPLPSPGFFSESSFFFLPSRNREKWGAEKDGEIQIRNHGLCPSGDEFRTELELREAERVRKSKSKGRRASSRFQRCFMSERKVKREFALKHAFINNCFYTRA